MVMREQNAVGPFPHGRAEDLSGMHQRGGLRTYRDLGMHEVMIFGIQKHHPKMLFVVITGFDELRDQSYRTFGVLDHPRRRLLGFPHHDPGGELQAIAFGGHSFPLLITDDTREAICISASTPSTARLPQALQTPVVSRSVNSSSATTGWSRVLPRFVQADSSSTTLLLATSQHDFSTRLPAPCGRHPGAQPERMAPPRACFHAPSGGVASSKGARRG